MSELRTFDAPGAQQIIAEVARFLDEEVHRNVPDERINYRVKVAANLLKLAARELAADVPAVDPDGRAVTEAVLSRHGGLAALTRALEAGDVSIVDAQVFEDLTRYVQLRTSVAAPPAQPKDKP